MYQTDLTETEWQYITKVLNLQERKRKYDLRMICNAIFYLVKTGCQWRMLPKEFPKLLPEMGFSRCFRFAS